MDGQLEIITLGGLVIKREGEPVTAFESDKVRALLVYLAVESERPHRRERLAGLLWPDFPERSARVNLRGALANLRSAIGDREATLPFLNITRQTIQFNTASESSVDVTEFTGLLESANGDGGTLSQLEEAVGSYTGSFLEGFSLPDSTAFEEWALLERERLQRLFGEALCQLADHFQERGAYDVALLHARHLVELDPLLEAAHRQVMHCLARSGQRSAALAQYESCYRVLSEELGVEPEAETAALYEEIVSGQVAAPVQVPDEPVHSLPSQLTRFVGRRDELAELHQLLSDPDVRLVTVVGPGGIGKTRLALQLAAARLQCYHHGVFFVSLAPLKSAESIIPALADAVGFSFYEGGEGQMVPSARQRLLDYLRGKTMLLVMDNYEHLLDGADFVSEVVQAAPKVKVLVTSRARLNLQEEQLYPLAGMDFPDWETPGDTTTYSAVALFLESARRVRPDFDVTGDNLIYLTRICRLVGGMPLGVLLAAGWVDTLPPSRIAAEIRRNLDFLETDLRNVPERQRSMRATFDHSWRLLSTRQRGVMEALSIFRGGFTWEAAQAIAGASLRELRALANRSLLEFIPRSGAETADGALAGRYELHELLRQYAEEKLNTSPAASATAHEHHCSYYSAALERWAADMKGARQVAALAEMRADRENLHAAWDWAVEQRQVARLGQAVEGLCRYYERRGRWQEGETLCCAAAESPWAKETQAASGQIGETASTERIRVLGKVLTWQGAFSYYMGRLETAGQLLRQGLDLLEEAEVAGRDTRADRAGALRFLAVVARDSGNPEERQRLSEQSLALNLAAGDRWGTALGLAGRAHHALNSGDHEAKRWAEESLALRRAIGDRWGTANALGVLGRIALERAEFEKAERLFREGVLIHQEIGHRGWESYAGLWFLIYALVYRGKFADAHTKAQEYAARAEDTGQLHSGPARWVWWVLGVVKLHVGDYADARAHFEIGLDVFRELHLRGECALTLSSLGGVALALEAYAEAHELLQESVALYQKGGGEAVNYWLTVALISSTYAARGVGEAVEARKYLCQALQQAIDFDNTLSLIQVVPAAALILSDARESARGGTERAVELYALASRYPHVANSQWYEDVVGKHITAVAQTLAPDVVVAAQERGIALDLWETAEELLDELCQWEKVND